MGKYAILDGTLRKVVAQATRNKNSPPLTPRILRLLREAALYVLGAVAIYLLISLWTYSSSDPSWPRGRLSAALVGACGLAGLHFAQSKTGMPFASGGWLGNAVGLGLASVFSFTGATLFLLALFLAGVTVVTGLSWLQLMDSVGYWSCALGDWLYQYVTAQVDRLIGMRARRARRGVVEEDKKV